METIVHLHRGDWKALLNLPESERIGALIRLNRTRYQNRLDAIRIYTILHERASRTKKFIPNCTS